jgi:hypothetical protein
LARKNERPRRVREALSRKLERMVDRSVAPRTDSLANEITRLNERVSQLHGQAAQSIEGMSHIEEQTNSLLEGVSEMRQWTAGSLDALRAEIGRLDARLVELRRIAGGVLDDIPALRRELQAARATDEYERAFADPEPLVTIRIPTYVRSVLLVERALPSIVRQTYQHFEVIVVGDGCTNDTAERVKDFGDPRVRFVNLPYRYPYPENREHRWMVAGAPGVNVGTEMSTGSWLAMLGDDDEFEPHHLECLLEKARASRAEMVYGNLRIRRPPPNEDEILARYPPEHGWFNFQAALFMAPLQFFEFSTRSWLLDEPSDWNLCRRMLETGVRIGYVDRPVTIHYPSQFWEPDQRGL